MRLLADLCIARLTIEGLRSDGHDVLSLAESGLNPTDVEILAMAVADGRIVLTEDSDFGTHIFHGGAASSGLIRVEQVSPADQLDIVRRVAALHETSLVGGAVVSARRTRIRVTPRPS
jgi:predicted nuclease of predicted toxin-antitoxin system